jgi:hypothetical protein
MSIMLFFIFFQKVITYLKMDIEGSEKPSMDQMFESGILKYVKQFSLEIHTGKGYPGTYIKMYQQLLTLEKLGFRRYLNHFNPACSFQSPKNRLYTGCQELYYININYLKEK